MLSARLRSQIETPNVPKSFEILAKVGRGEGFKNSALLFSVSALFLRVAQPCLSGN